MFIQRRFTKLAMILTLPSFLFSLTACELENADAIAAAQSCLNEMNSSMSAASLASKAAECRSLISGIDNEKAFVIECSSYFLENGFFGTKISTAFQRVSDTADTTNDTSQLLSAFTFTSTSTASSAQTACAKTGVKTLETFGAMANASTTVGNAAGLLGTALVSTPLTADAFETALASVTTDAQKEALGSSISAMGSALCDSDTNSTSGLDSACTTLNAITGSGASNLVIGNCAAFCLQDGNSGSTCTGSSIVCP